MATAGAPENLRPAALAIVDVAFPRQDGAERLQALARAVPGMPLLALSPTFFAGVAAAARWHGGSASPRSCRRRCGATT